MHRKVLVTLQRQLWANSIGNRLQALSKSMQVIHSVSACIVLRKIVITSYQSHSKNTFCCSYINIAQSGRHSDF